MSEYKDDKTPSETPEEQPQNPSDYDSPVPDNSDEPADESANEKALTGEQVLDDPEELDRQLQDAENEKDLKSNTSPLEENISPEDLEYMSDTSAAVLMKTPRGGRLLIYTMLLAIGSAIIWASVAPLDEITRGMGKVIPSTHLQVIQNLEGGILEELFVREGELVKEGQPLLQLDDTRFKSTFRESAVEYYSELAKAARLKAELSGTPLKFPPELSDHQSYVDREVQIFQRREAGLKAELDISNKQASQAKHELAASEAQLEFLATSLELGEEELELTTPLAEQGVVSHVEMIQLKQRVNDLASEKRMTELSIPKLNAAYQEALARKRELTIKFREEVVQELKDAEVRLDQLSETQTNLEDQVVRTLLRSPVEGIVKKINVKTVGGVVQPGMDVMEIVPVEDTLLVEAQIAPKDIGFLREGMKSVVKLTAYDFAVYGGLEGLVEHISADTIKDEKGESFYIVRIRTHENQLGSPEQPLEIIPGMKANIDIITGEKTLMEYLMKPILRARQNALTER
ncbi:HlyD family type I secretion periplasmic adaptor subunit [Endozoicomonas numazuensis]|uniref:HlyD family type I secretion periplasmic adaptor subunit n=1 Tax=Endozoicomonas numazuensis TaxID=1137799 RepID=UPI0009E07E9A|nr:HlyD family type I secretion periplasmic adaptor subunit [Endozoicomonas numazuensis]